ncbi:MAG: type II secretion system protein [Thermodesulfovibrionales bacterium]
MKQKHREFFFTISPCHRVTVSYNGFTLLEVIVAIAILGIAISVVLQLFSANLRAISVSGDYVTAATRAEAKMREILSDDRLSEKSFSEATQEGYRIDVSITDVLKERTENLQVKLLEVDLTIHWIQGTKQKSMSLRTFKVVEKIAG